MRLVWVAIAGAAGAAARYGLGRAFEVREFPWVTLAINITGSFLLGLVLGAAAARDWPQTATATIGTGFLGAYTTFSTFSYETQTLLRSGRVGAAAGYVGGSLAGGVAAAAAGWALARSIA